jgi:uncharacterized protein
MKKSALVLAAICFMATAYAQSESYTQTLKKYLEVSGTTASFKVAVTGMIGNFKTINPAVPDEVWKEFENEFLNASANDLITHFAPVYQKHLTENDLQEIIKFYSTPAGKKLAEKTPALTQESMQAGQIWGQAVAQKVLTKLKEKGY